MRRKAPLSVFSLIGRCREWTPGNTSGLVPVIAFKSLRTSTALHGNGFLCSRRVFVLWVGIVQTAFARSNSGHIAVRSSPGRGYSRAISFSAALVPMFPS